MTDNDNGNVLRPDYALKFFERFQCDTITIASITEHGAPNKAFKLPHFYSTKHSAGGKPKVTATVTLQEFVDPNFIKELAYLQKLKRAIYFMVNDSDGLCTDEEPNTNRRENVQKITACFADTDNCPVEVFIAYLKRIKLIPHIVVRTSPHKYHFYFLIEPVGTDEAERWQAIQTAIPWMGDTSVDRGMDKSMHDLTQLMRLPGFLHQKKNPKLIEVKKENFHSPYSIDEVFEKVGAINFYDDVANRTKYTYPTRKISAGERHEAYRNYALSVANDLVGDELIYEKTLDAVDGFMLKNFDKPYTFLQGGHRRKEVLRTIKDAITLASEKIVVDIPEIDEAEAEESALDKFALSPTFYYNAPGIIGELVRFICKQAVYPIPSFTFATLATLFGTLKAPFITSSKGHAPANYFLCLAPTGTGKEYPQDVMSHTLNAIGIPNIASSRVRSARGILVKLKKNSSCAVLTIDEVEGLLQSFTDINAPHYLRDIKGTLLELYTKTNVPIFDTGDVSDEKVQPVILNYPRLNLIWYSVTSTLDNAFSLESIRDGLFQRFLIITHMHSRRYNEEYKPPQALPEHYCSRLREILTESKLMSFDLVEKLETLRIEHEETKSKSEKQKIEKEMLSIQKSLAERPKRVLPFESDAEQLLVKYTHKLNKQYDRSVKNKQGYEGLFTRGAEQVGRLAVALCDTEKIPKTLIEYVIDFVDSRINALHEYVAEGMGKNHYQKTKNELYTFIFKQYKKNKEPVAYRYVSQHFFSAKSRSHMRDLLDSLYDDGRIRQMTPPTKGGRGAKGETFIPVPPRLDEL